MPRMTIFDGFWFVRSNWLLISICFVIAVCIALALALTAEPRYRSSVGFIAAPSVGAKSDGFNIGGSVGALLGGGGGGQSIHVVTGRLTSVAYSVDFMRRHPDYLKAMFEDQWDDVTGWKESDPKGAFPNMVSSSTAPEKKTVNSGPTDWEIYKKLNKRRWIDINEATSIARLSVEWETPDGAASLANTMIADFNQVMSLKAVADTSTNIERLTEKISKGNVPEVRNALASLVVEEMQRNILAQTEQNFAVEVIDPAAPSDDRHWPKRTLMVIVGVFAGVLFGVAAALLRESWRQGRDQHRSDLGDAEATLKRRHMVSAKTELG